MKLNISYFLISVLSIIQLQCLGQDNLSEIETESILSNKNLSIKWNLSLILNYHKEFSNVKPGFAIEAIVNQRLVIGVFGQFTSGNFSLPYKNYQQNILSQDFGIIIGSTERTEKLIHIGFHLKTGVILLHADSTKEINFNKHFKSTSSDKGITVYPEVNASLNVSKVIKLRIGTGYNFLMLDKETVVEERRLDTWFLNTAIVFSPTLNKNKKKNKS